MCSAGLGATLWEQILARSNRPARLVETAWGNGNFGPVADVRTAASENLLVNRARTPAARASQPCLPGCGGGGNVAGPRALQC